MLLPSEHFGIFIKTDDFYESNACVDRISFYFIYFFEEGKPKFDKKNKNLNNLYMGGLPQISTVLTHCNQ